MTRSNLNFVWQNSGESPRTLFHYHNGDQYPEGLLQFYGLEGFLTLDHLWTPDDFRAWISGNYRTACRKIATLPNGIKIDMHAETDDPAEPDDLGEGGQPKIFYTDGFLTDYTYVFTHRSVPGRKRKDGTRPYKECNWVRAWNWDRLIFSGSAKRFLTFCGKRVQPTIVPAEVSLKGSIDAALASAFSSSPTPPLPASL